MFFIKCKNRYFIVLTRTKSASYINNRHKIGNACVLLNHASTRTRWINISFATTSLSFLSVFYHEENCFWDQLLLNYLFCPSSLINFSMPFNTTGVAGFTSLISKKQPTYCEKNLNYEKTIFSISNHSSTIIQQLHKQLLFPEPEQCK